MLSDLRYALRQLTKYPGFTAVALLTLALGIGINTTAFTLVNQILYRLPPYRDPARLVAVHSTMPQSQFSKLAPANARDVTVQSTVFESTSPWCFEFAGLAQPGKPANRVIALTVSGDFFSMLGVSPIMGRALMPSDDSPGRSDVIVASERFWREKLGGDPNAVGSVLRLDGKPVTVVGVAPDNCQDFIQFGPVDVWEPLGYGADKWSIRDNDWMDFIARLKPGVSLAQAQAQLNTIAAHLAQDHPDTNSGRGLNVASYRDSRSRGPGPVLWSVMGLMVFVLLIACVNLANLQLARTVGRAREYAIRIALGASRGQLIRQLLAESVLLSLSGGALGLLVAVWGNRLLGSRIQLNGEYAGLALPIDYRVLGFTLAASVATGVVFGLMPAWSASRTDVNSAVKQGGRGTAGDSSKHRLRRALVVAELALALASLVGAAYFVRGIQRYDHMDYGWRSENLVTGNFVLPWSKYSNDDKTRSGVDRLRTGLEALPGVDRVAISGAIPLGGAFSHRGSLLIEGQPPPPKGLEPLAYAERVTPGYFSTLGIHLLAGRDFDANDREDSKRVVIINSAMARKFWPEGDAIGHRIGGTDPRNPDWREIVGVVNDIVIPAGFGLTQFETYRPFSQDPDHWLTFTLHSRGSPAALSEDARRAVTRVDPDLAVYDLGTVDSIAELQSANLYLVEHMLTIAALLGLLLALVGIYGVIANLAIQRTQEIGIRMALGAQTRTILWLIARDGAQLAAVGTAIGLVLAYWLSRGLSLAMPQIQGQDSLVMVELAALLVVATLAACSIPALRATHVNPVEALRSE